MKKTCPICEQKMDVYTTTHKNVPFVNNKTYPMMCFTCYFVPKINEQKYGKDGSVTEERELEYSPANLQTPKELYDSGASETLKQAKLSVAAVEALCKGVRPPKKPQKRPDASWNIC